MSKISKANQAEESETEESHDSSGRCLVLGSVGYSGVDSVEWDTDELPNIVDYDTVIVDVRSLDEKKLPSVTNERLETLRVQLTRLLDSKGEIIVLTDYKKGHKRPEEYPDYADNYDWCPIDIGLSKESGETLEIKDSYFSGYIKHLQHWPYFFVIPTRYLTRELENFYGSSHSTRYSVPCSPFVQNRYGKTIAGICHIEVTKGQKKSPGYSTYEHYPKKPDVVTGRVVLLPLIERLDHKEAVRIVLEDITGVSLDFAPPSWVDDVDVPHVLEIENEIKEKEQQIDSISAEIGKLQNRKASLHEYRKLLYSSGFDLEEIVKRCFEEMGAKVTPAKYGEEEYILEYQGNEYLVEVKGVSKSISLGHLRQLNDYILKYEEDTGKACKGILFGNSWRTIPPHERGTQDKPEFPQNVTERAEQWGAALISSTKFFEAYCKFLNDRSPGSIILKDIISGVGVIDFLKSE